MDIAQNLPAALAQPGSHLTRQRRLVLKILNESHAHPDAGIIFQEAKRRDERISLATVYRSLDFLKKAGLVEENSFGEDHGHFETIQQTHHHHFTCTSCGKVVELEGARIHKMLRASGERHGLQVIEVSIHLQGYCPDCRK